MNQITVVFDGECDFCKQSVTWIQRKLTVKALPFQTTDLTPFNLTREQCAKQVYVIAENATYEGAAGIAYLLKQRGNTLLWLKIKISGPFGRAGYRWIASHRNSIPVKLATRLLSYLNGK
jgi:predicted DCC family thiol-disulfide oxidoreductase YuxK